MLLARYITTLFGQQASELISEAEAVCGSDRGGGGGGGLYGRRLKIRGHNKTRYELSFDLHGREARHV